MQRTRTTRVRHGGKFESSRPIHSIRKGSYRRLGKRLSSKTKYDYNHNLKIAWQDSQKDNPQLRRSYLHKFAPEQEVPWLYRQFGVTSSPGSPVVPE